MFSKIWSTVTLFLPDFRVKNTARNRILALAIAMQLSIDETNILLTDAKLRFARIKLL